MKYQSFNHSRKQDIIKTEGWGSTVSIIGNIIENKWFDMKKFFEEYEVDK